MTRDIGLNFVRDDGHELAEEFDSYLEKALPWGRDSFGSEYAWSGPIPPKDQWESEVDALIAMLIEVWGDPTDDKYPDEETGEVTEAARLIIESDPAVRELLYSDAWQTDSLGLLQSRMIEIIQALGVSRAVAIRWIHEED